MSHLPPPWCTAISHSVKGPPYTRGNVPRHHSIGQGSYLTSLAWGTVHLPYFGCLATPIRLIPNRVTQGEGRHRDRGSRVSRFGGCPPIASMRRQEPAEAGPRRIPATGPLAPAPRGHRKGGSARPQDPTSPQTLPQPTGKGRVSESERPTSTTAGWQPGHARRISMRRRTE